MLIRVSESIGKTKDPYLKHGRTSYWTVCTGVRGGGGRGHGQHWTQLVMIVFVCLEAKNTKH